MDFVFVAIVMGLTVMYMIIEGILLGRAEGVIQKVVDEQDKIMVSMIAKNGKYVVFTFEKPVKKLGGGYDLDAIRRLPLVGRRCIVHLIKQNRVDKFYLFDNGEKKLVPKVKE